MGMALKSDSDRFQRPESGNIITELGELTDSVPGDHFEMDDYIRFGYGEIIDDMAKAPELVKEGIRELEKNNQALKSKKRWKNEAHAFIFDCFLFDRPCSVLLGITTTFRSPDEKGGRRVHRREKRATHQRE
jgi:hypothetical protein